MCSLHENRPGNLERLGRRTHRLRPPGHSASALALAPSDASVAQAFYGGALRGRQLRPASRRNAARSLWFLIAGQVVEVGCDRGAAAAPVALHVDDPDLMAQRCWDAGFTVRVRQDATGRAPVSVYDPFGRRIDLVPSAALTAGLVQPQLAAGKEAS